MEDGILGGSAGLAGRKPIVRVPDPDANDFDDEGAPIYTPQPSKAIPANCLRVLSSPLRPEHGGGCNMDCAGRQKDGSCLAEIVRAANAQGVDWLFQLESEGDRWWWTYVGPPLAEAPEVEEAASAPPSFVCPHCGRTNEQDLANFNFWCACGKNANDPA